MEAALPLGDVLFLGSSSADGRPSNDEDDDEETEDEDSDIMVIDLNFKSAINIGSFYIKCSLSSDGDNRATSTEN